MKAIAFNGRKDGNTAIMTRWVFDELEKEGIETELYQMKGKRINGCIACYKCFENKDQRCAVEKDDLNECIEKMLTADSIILASPVYFSDVTSQIKALIDPCSAASWGPRWLLPAGAGPATLSLH
jgi:multimeric flavodoxin WrbA